LNYECFSEFDIGFRGHARYPVTDFCVLEAQKHFGKVMLENRLEQHFDKP
jgi:hypothetical protein